MSERNGKRVRGRLRPIGVLDFIARYDFGGAAEVERVHSRPVLCKSASQGRRA